MNNQDYTQPEHEIIIDPKKQDMTFKGAAFIGFILSLVSTCFSVNLLSSLGSNGWESFLFSVSGICFQFGGQIIAFIFGWIFLSQKRSAPAMVAFCVYAFIFCLSMLATVGAFVGGSQAKSKQVGYQDEKYLLMKNELSTLDAAITQDDKLITDYARRTIITKGVKPTREHQDGLRVRRQAIMDQMQAFVPQSSGDEIFRSIALFWGLKDFEEIQKVKFFVFAAVAIAIDLLAGCLIGFSIIGKVRMEKDETALPYPDNYPQTHDGHGFDRVPHRQTYDRHGFDDQKVRREPAPVNAPSPDDDPEPDPMPGHAPAYAERVETDDPDIDQKSKQPIGFTGTVPGTGTGTRYGYGVQPDIVRAYINELFPKPGRKNGSLVSRRRIGQKLGINIDIQNEIHTFLKRRGCIRVEGNLTLANMKKAEMLNEIR